MFLQLRSMSFTSIPWIRSRSLFLFILVFLTYITGHARAIGVQFVDPLQDGTFPAGPLNVTWTNGGGSPDMSMLTNYQLDLIVGGNLGVQDSKVIQSMVIRGLVSTGHTTVNVSSNSSQSIQNGFYLCMTSNATDGRTVLNYSGRFTLIGMTGVTDPVYVQGAAAYVGGSNVPASQVNVPIPVPSNNASVTPTSSGIASSTSTTSDAPSSSSSGISNGAIIGAAVTGVVFGIALVALSWWIWAVQKRRKQRREEQKTQLDDGGYMGSKAELPTQSASNSTVSTPVVASLDEPVELADRRITSKAYELRGSDHDTLAEMEGPPIVHELEGEWTGWEMSNARRSMQHSYDPTK